MSDDQAEKLADIFGERTNALASFTEQFDSGYKQSDFIGFPFAVMESVGPVILWRKSIKLVKKSAKRPGKLSADSRKHLRLN